MEPTGSRIAKSTDSAAYCPPNSLLRGLGGDPFLEDSGVGLHLLRELSGEVVALAGIRAHIKKLRAPGIKRRTR
ncbi:MAG: hypothetical protein DMG08_13585 [Acidobacteria bacterium]|nr:MAG: hypothetical protein DMG08_13585 [Acidobacteriota bacterium]